MKIASIEREIQEYRLVFRYSMSGKVTKKTHVSMFASKTENVTEEYIGSRLHARHLSAEDFKI